MDYLRDALLKIEEESQQPQKSKALADALAGEPDFAELLAPRWAEYSPLTVVSLWTAVCLSVGLNPDHRRARLSFVGTVAEYVAGPTGEAMRDALVRYKFALHHAMAGADLRTVGRAHDIDLATFAAWARRNSVQLPAQFPARAAVGLCDTADETPITRAALIFRYGPTWKTLQSDLRHAKENGLKSAATATRGFWYASRALEWADQRNKRPSTTPQEPTTSLPPWPPRTPGT